MKLFSNNNNTWLRIERNVAEDHESFDVEASVDLGHGRFHGRNSDLCWLNMAEFESGLEAFARDRTGAPNLEGTYGSFLRFRAAAGLVVVEFAIGDAYCGSETHDFLLEGSFEIEQGSLLRLAREFQLQSTGIRS